ncbi:hypothetical protein LSAT2_010450 [Lamellibrachia satsuma]|nr:hypothetical protein LSAT2_010450 [Lamellibrachia satsuma]
MKLAIVAVTLLLLQASLLTMADTTTDDLETGSGGYMTTEESSPMQCYVCGQYDGDMKPESECGESKTTYNKEGCPSGSDCWIYKETVDNTVTYARGCYNATECSEHTDEKCATANNKELCKKCCTTNLCNSGKLTLSNDSPKFGVCLFTLVYGDVPHQGAIWSQPPRFTVTSHSRGDLVSTSQVYGDVPLQGATWCQPPRFTVTSHSRGRPGVNLPGLR